jgi:Ca-activated chloride channel family protein
MKHSALSPASVPSRQITRLKEVMETGNQFGRFARRCRLPLAFLVLCASLSAQAPIVRKPSAAAEPPVPTLQLQSRLVTIAVNAVDAQGGPVAGLEKADFRLLEDGRLQKIAFFDKESSTPLSIVLAIDASESLLRNEKLEQKAANRFVKTILRPQDELDVIEFSDSVQELIPFTNDAGRIEDALGRLRKGDATAMYDAIYLASQELGKTSASDGRRRVLVLVTDGGDDISKSSYTQAVEQAQRAGVIVYSLIIIPIYADAGRNTGGEHALIQMSADTGGKYFYIEDAKDLTPALAKVSEDLRTQYVLGYYAPARTPGSRSDGFRTIKVEDADPDAAGKVTLRYRTGYYASK